MSKNSTAAKTIEARKESMAKILAGGFGDSAPEGEEEPAGQGSKPETKDTPRPKQNRKMSPKGIASDNPLVQKALRNSTIQKTLRFPPMLIVEYEQSCEAKGMAPNFNAHMGEALELWLARQKR